MALDLPGTMAEFELGILALAMSFRDAFGAEY